MIKEKGKEKRKGQLEISFVYGKKAPPGRLNSKCLRRLLLAELVFDVQYGFTLDLKPL